MKPNTATQNLSLTNSIEAVKMGFDIHSTKHIIGLLTDLYSNKILAAIREYSTNAWDSHVEAGNLAPIHVRRPNISDPTFEVRDFGVGLSRDEIATVYSMYGTSTKRETNDANGMLGLGCKSGLTYAVQFTVDAVKDGMRTVATIGKGEDGVGEIQILAHQPTFDPNGVAIRIPVAPRDIEKFNETIDEFFWYWREGVLVNGEVPVNVTTDEDWTAIDPDVFIREYSYGRQEHHVVQGNVAYPFERSHSADTVQVVAFVPIGMVDFTPSREDLHFTDRTEEVVREVRRFVANKTLQSFNDGLATITSDWERLCHYMKWRNVLPRHRNGRLNYTWPEFSKYQNLGTHGWMVDVHKSGSKHTSLGDFTLKRSKAMKFPTELAMENNRQEAFFVYNFDPGTFTDSHYRRLLLAGMPEGLERFYTLPVSYSRQVDTSSFPGIDWDTVPGLPREKRKSGDGSTTVSRQSKGYLVYRGGSRPENGEAVDVNDIDAATTVHMVCQNRKHALEGDHALRSFLHSRGIGVVLLTNSQKVKFREERPDVVSMSEWHEAQRKRVRAKITPEIASILAIPHWTRDFVRRFGPVKSRITNPHFLSLIDDRTVPEALMTEINEFSVDASDLFPQYTASTRKSYDEDFKESYPLVGDYDPRYRSYQNSNYEDHVVSYINQNVPKDWDKQEDDDTGSSDASL